MLSEVSICNSGHAPKAAVDKPQEMDPEAGLCWNSLAPVHQYNACRFLNHPPPFYIRAEMNVLFCISVARNRERGGVGRGVGSLSTISWMPTLLISCFCFFEIRNATFVKGLWWSLNEQLACALNDFFLGVLKAKRIIREAWTAKIYCCPLPRLAHRDHLMIWKNCTTRRNNGLYMHIAKSQSNFLVEKFFIFCRSIPKILKYNFTSFTNTTFSIQWISHYASYISHISSPLRMIAMACLLTLSGHFIGIYF